MKSKRWPENPSVARVEPTLMFSGLMPLIIMSACRGVASRRWRGGGHLRVFRTA